MIHYTAILLLTLHLPTKHEAKLTLDVRVAGVSLLKGPAAWMWPTRHAAVAQTAEQLFCKQPVAGATPARGSTQNLETV